jgi:hypothetical protein
MSLREAAQNVLEALRAYSPKGNHEAHEFDALQEAGAKLLMALAFEVIDRGVHRLAKD